MAITFDRNWSKIVYGQTKYETAAIEKSMFEKKQQENYNKIKKELAKAKIHGRDWRFQVNW